MNKPTKEKMDKWLITAMSHMKTIYEENGIPWSEEDEEMFQAIRDLIENGPEVDRKFVRRWANSLNFAMYADAEYKRLIKLMLREAGVLVKEV